MLKINQTKNEKNVTVELDGRLDTNTAPELDAALGELMEGAESLVLDFEKLEYVSSAGLRVLLSAQKTMSKQGEMKLLHVNETIGEIFEGTGFCDILTIE